jgi:hypothetical protein
MFSRSIRTGDLKSARDECYNSRFSGTCLEVAGGTYSIQQGPSWEADRFWASKEINRNLWNSNVHYRVYKSPQPDPNLSQINPVQAPGPTTWRSTLILSSHRGQGLRSGLISSRSPTKTTNAPLLSPYVLYASPISLFSIWEEWEWKPGFKLTN